MSDFILGNVLEVLCSNCSLCMGGGECGRGVSSEWGDGECGH